MNNIMCVHVVKGAEDIKLMVSVFTPFLVLPTGLQVELGEGLVTNKNKT